MRLFVIYCLFVTLLVGAGNTLSAQGKYGKVGKIFSVEEANNLFGQVKAKKTINTVYLKKVLKKAKHYVRLKLKNNFMTILEDEKDIEKFNSQFSETAITTDDTPEHLFSKEVVEELLQKGGSDVTTIEERDGVLTVTNGAYTMEFASGCPPFCA